MPMNKVEVKHLHAAADLLRRYADCAPNTTKRDDKQAHRLSLELEEVAARYGTGLPRNLYEKEQAELAEKRKAAGPRRRKYGARGW